jgi:hypothetical protein
LVYQQIRKSLIMRNFHGVLPNLITFSRLYLQYSRA